MTVSTNFEHPRDDLCEVVPDYMTRLLPPVGIDPYVDDEGELVLSAEAVHSLGVATGHALEFWNMPSRKDTISDEAVQLAVYANFRERFEGAHNSTHSFYRQKGWGIDSGIRKLFDLHHLIRPDEALIFKKMHPGLPSVDVAASVVTDETREITREVIADTLSHFGSSRPVMGDFPSVSFVDLAHQPAHERVFSVEKVVTTDPANDISLKRRKTYVADATWVNEILATQPQEFPRLFMRPSSDRLHVHPVIESIFAVNGAVDIE